MNVKVCSFPEGEDPDSFAKNNSHEEIRLYLQENSKDFIQFKASLLFEESKNDPIKKAEIIRDIVQSISKIPDQIKREIYVQECARLLDIGEDVLFSTLAQISSQLNKEQNKQFKSEQKAFDVIRREETNVQKVDIQFELEQKIIEILLLYGNKTEQFDDIVLKENEYGELAEEQEVHECKVFEKIYLDLQEDEMEFGNSKFKELYYIIIDRLNQNPSYDLKNLITQVSPELASEISSIVMNEERYQLSNWERMNIYPKEKSNTIAQLVSETILNLRCFLIDQKVVGFQEITKSEVDNTSILEDVMNYSNLKMLLSRKLRRVV